MLWPWPLCSLFARLGLPLQSYLGKPHAGRMASALQCKTLSASTKFKPLNTNGSVVDIDAVKRSSSLEELLGLYDEAFVRRAYQMVLGREADRNGLIHSVARMRDGDDPLAILASLRFSPEGREVGIFFPELDAAVRPYRGAFHPVWGRLLRKLRLASRISSERRQINKLQNQLARLAAGEVLDHVDSPSATDISSVPSHKLTGNVSIAARIWLEKPAIQRILLLKLDHFGDFFVAVRAFSLIRKAWPQAHITLICGSWNVQFAKKLELFDEIIPFDMPGMIRQPETLSKTSWFAQCEGVKSLPLRRYNLAVDLRHDMDTRPCLLHVEADFKAGYENDMAKPWPGGASPINISLHQSHLHAELRCTLLAQLVITTLQPPEKHPISALVRDAGVNLPFASGTYLVICPGAAAGNRVWPAERFIELLRLVREEVPYHVVFAGAAEDRPAVTKIAKSLPEGGYVDLCGRPFEDLPWIFSNAALFIGCDSGPGHLSALLGTPTLSIYGGVSPPHIWQPLGPLVGIVHSQTPCAYCHDRECAYDFRCTKEIEVRDVFIQFKELISVAGRERGEGGT